MITPGAHDQRQSVIWYPGVRFFRDWLRNPLAIGAVAPSGRYLAELMVTDLQAGATVIELGAGTGVLTQAILSAGVCPHDLFVFEQNAELAGFLVERFPGVRVIEANAVSLHRHVAQLPGPVDFIISGLPLLSFTRPSKIRLLSRGFELLQADGRFHQFTYAGRCPVRRSLLDYLGLRASLIGFTPYNVPPAFVYRFQRG